MIELQDLQIKLDRKVVSDAGASMSHADGTLVNFNRAFIDIQQINAQPGTSRVDTA